MVAALAGSITSSKRSSAAAWAGPPPLPPAGRARFDEVAAERWQLDRLWPQAEAGGDSATTGGAGGRGDNIERILSKTHKEIDSKGAKEPDTPRNVLDSV